MAEDVVDAVIANLADLAPINWDAVAESAGGPGEGGVMECLRILGGIADLHRAAALESDEAAETQTAAPRSPGAGQPLTQWGKYLLRQRVGEGGFGAVYRAWDPDLEIEVAIKILHRRIADARLKQALLREGRALAKVRHDNVVRVLSVESHDDQIALRMEFVQGETLDEVILRQGTLNAREAAVVGEDVCRALAAVHHAGFVHRDVKARNVMRETAGRIVLMDFGAGQQAADLKVPGKVANVGTPLYMAPEVIAEEPATASSDVYSVGVLLYYLVTGHYPVEGKSFDEIRRAHREGRRRALGDQRPDIAPAFAGIVEQALAPEPSKRFASARALLEALRAFDAATRKSLSLKRVLTVVGSTVFGVVFAGFLTSGWYNLMIGRTAPFNRESPLIWLEMGLRSLVTPVVYIGLLLLVAAAVQFVLRVFGLSRGGDRVLAGLRRQRSTVARRLGLDDPHVFSQAVAAAGVIGLVLVGVRFSHVLIACSTQISDAPLEDILPLRWDDQRGYDFSLYRVVLDAMVLLFIAAVFRIKRLQGRGEDRSRAPLVPIVALLAVAVLLLEVPYRLGWHATAERVLVGTDRCYMLGADGGNALLYCPEKAIPRNVVVSLERPDVTRTGVIENIFSSPYPPR